MPNCANSMFKLLIPTLVVSYLIYDISTYKKYENQNGAVFKNNIVGSIAACLYRLPRPTYSTASNGRYIVIGSNSAEINGNGTIKINSQSINFDSQMFKSEIQKKIKAFVNLWIQK